MLRLKATLLVCLISTTIGWSQQDSLWLEGAQIAVRFLGDEKREVTQSIKIHSEAAVSRARIEHLMFLRQGESISNLRIDSPQGRAKVDIGGTELETRLWVTCMPSRTSNDLSYDLVFEVSTIPFRCPIAVPLLYPRDPHFPVTLEIELLPEEEVVGPTFPNLETAGEKHVGRMGGVPSFVQVPSAERGGGSWLARNGVDLFVLILTIGCALVWLRLRRVRPTDEKELA